METVTVDETVRNTRQKKKNNKKTKTIVISIGIFYFGH